MSIPAAPAGGNQNRATELDALSWTWLSISTTVVGFRIYSRGRVTRNLWWDDWFIVMSWILVTTFTILWTVLGSYGGCRHLYYIQPAQRIRVLKINYITQGISIMAVGTGKISVALLILRIMGKSSVRKAFLYFSMATSFLLCGLGVITTYVQCKPVMALWDPHVKGDCWNPSVQSNLSIFIGAWMGFLDISLALLPITIMWNLQLAWQKKIGICSLMGMGIFAGVCAAIKTSQLTQLAARSDITWATVELYIWVANECNVIIIAASIPTLRPLYLLMFKRDTHTSNNIYRPSYERTLRNKIRATSTPLRDSSTVMMGESGDLQSSDNQYNTPAHGRIRQTIELQITSKKRNDSLEEQILPL